VRTGLELSSPLRYTLALHALVEISERRLNDQGLARLRTADGRGWLSEQLNPLSGHRGPIATLLPMPTVLKVKVAIPEGALVRQSCELSSPSIRLVPRGEELLVVRGDSGCVTHYSLKTCTFRIISSSFPALCRLTKTSGAPNI